MTATTNPERALEIAPLVAPAENTVLYMARRSELRLTLKSRFPMLNPVTGQREGMTRGIFAGFREGALRVPREGKVTLVDTLDGGESEEMDASVVHDMLERHRRFGDMNEGFWRVEPVAPPVSREEFARISEAGAGWDRETLEEIIRQESEGWNREDVLRVARGTIARIDQLEEQVQARAAEVANEEVAAERAAREKAEKAAADAEAKLKARK